MPAVITHDTFGREVYDSLYMMVGESRDEFQAFLLGNQGPDALFFGVLDPRTVKVVSVGTQMHNEQPVELIAAFRDAVDAVSPDFAMPTGGSSPQDPTASARDIARAYALGFLCHYLLDNEVHPFIYAQQWALCDAGVPGLDRSCAHEVHATIESELDELVLSTKSNRTISQFDPSHKTLVATDHVLNVVSALYERVVSQVYGKRLPAGSFRICTKAYRVALRALWSPSGAKREVLTSVERLFRNHSYLRAMSHQDRKLYESDFDNSEHAEWMHPDMSAVRTESFWDLYDAALRRAYIDVAEYAEVADPREFATRITGARNFNGVPVGAVITDVTTIGGRMRQ